ncbi:polysaccharide pyruvyl transferase family protein [Ideonella livida]|uniref:Polysaccharide pyruvyl transferase family protein n=1 Tax=Ideonella livida TaxID=2707176 RepID=A0A7C9TJA1_9BURK|nr:polysaccharide pyruvyl transferase family protein [Ideonella livida]NDY91939.1 polysaccharide pyruvyl transferase family protein [Ideonella livida]
MNNFQAKPHTALLNARYFRKIRNIGDQITPLIAGAVSGLNIRFCGNQEAHLLSLGSIAASANNASVMWGTGVMGPEFSLPATKPFHISALRGKSSAAHLRAQGWLDRDVPLGDPGILVSDMENVLFERRPTQTGKIGFVPHYSDRSHPAAKEFLKKDGVTLLDVHSSPEKFLTEMSECEAIVSSSLHGLIFADALGIKSTWVTIANKIGGGEFKFLDYYSTTQDGKTSPTSLTENSSLAEILGAGFVSSSAHLKHDLRGAFPIEALQSSGAVTEMPEGYVALEKCRSVIFESFQLTPEELSRLSSHSSTAHGVFSAAFRRIKSHFSTWSEPAKFSLFSEKFDLSASESKFLSSVMNLLDKSPAYDIYAIDFSDNQKVSPVEPITGEKLTEWASLRQRFAICGRTASLGRQTKIGTFKNETCIGHQANAI